MSERPSQVSDSLKGLLCPTKLIAVNGLEREREKGNNGTKRNKDDSLKKTIMKKVHKRRWKETEKGIREVNGCVCE